MAPSTVSGVNLLSEAEKRAIYSRLIPPELLERFAIGSDLCDDQQRDLLELNAPAGSTTSEMSLWHQHDFPDPILYGDITDSLTGQIHVLLYVLNDPDSPRFDVDRMPDGRATRFGILCRNLEAEQAAMDFGLAPGQIRKGLRMLGEAIQAFEHFVNSLGHNLFFAEPLYYHNAIIFEHYGFAYQRGRRLMEGIQTGFEQGGELRARLDNSTPFRMPQAAGSVRMRSWAIHDGLLGEPYTNVTMYKEVGKHAGVDTCPGSRW
jgi:hypothetical protein